MFSQFMFWSETEPNTFLLCSLCKVEKREHRRDVPAKPAAAVPVNLELERLRKLNASPTAELAMKTRPWVNMKKWQSEVLHTGVYTYKISLPMAVRAKKKVRGE